MKTVNGLVVVHWERQWLFVGETGLSRQRAQRVFRVAMVDTRHYTFVLTQRMYYTKSEP